VALLQCSEQGCFILAEKTASQIEIHKKYGGVVPEMAGRLHAEKIVPLLEAVLKGQPKPEVLAITSGPGLITGLIVGTEATRVLSYALDLPIVNINHLEGHIHSVEILKSKSSVSDQPTNKIQYPALALIVSGGHTELVYIKNQGEYKILGKTKDDAAGECFDKVAKLLNLPYPGGPQISRLAATGRTDAVTFPRPMIHENSYNFSFAGLKTSALYWLRDNKLSALNTGLGIFNILNLWDRFALPKPAVTREDFCASFEQAIIDVLIFKTLKAAAEYQPQTIILAGGVSANQKLREALKKSIKNCELLVPELPYCMDNAAMIAIAGYYKAQKKDFTPWPELIPNSNWELAFS
jgi:N6-L-threonylcarbamoyladenine synthase